jgi:diadenosine tetraphosphatase ApaH/serine/threonine PP2A family protein phosphatase
MTVEQKGKDVSSMTFTGKDGQKVVMDVGNGKLPADYPKDVPVYDGAKVILSQSASEKNTHNLVLESNDPPEKIAEFYKKGLESNGWKIESTMNMGEMSMFTASKDKRQAVVQVPRGPLVVNPGSVGCPVFGDIPIATQLEYRSPHARYALLTERRGHWQAELLALTYDWDRAAARAMENGFPHWASAYASGAVI